LLQSPAQTDSRLHAKEFNETIKEIFAQLSLKKFLLEGFVGSFDIDVFHERKRAFLAPQCSINAYSGASNRNTELPHLALYYDLKKLRDAICAKKDLPIYYVAGTRTLEEMTTYLPQTMNELEQISGFGKAKLEIYGKAFLDIIVEYSKKHNLSSRISEKTPKRKRRDLNGSKIDTKAETFRLYREGKTINEIAKERKLAVSTIEGHLTHFIQTGQIEVEELVSQQKIIVMEPVVKEFYNGTLTSIRERLGEEFSYSEIRFVCAWHEFRKKSSSHINH
jgi:ribonuclease D